MTRAAYLLIILIAAGVLAFPRSGYPAQATEKPAPVQEAAFQTSPVTIDGSELFQVRGVQAFPADDRANHIVDSIEKTARNHSISSDAITMVESELTTDIVAGKRVIMSVH